MENVITLNGETFVKVSQVSNHGLYAQIYYVYRTCDKDLSYSKGIGFLNYETALKYKHLLEKQSGMLCFIFSKFIIARF